MPDEDPHAKFHAFDREPNTGSQSSTELTEHADLGHRIEADNHSHNVDSTPIATTPVAPAPQAQPESPHFQQPPAAAPISQTAELPRPGPGLMVLQWLVYALWGWTLLILGFMVTMVVSYLLRDEGSNSDSISYWEGGGTTYVLAAVIVLFVVSLACDLFYAHAERSHQKSAGTNVIMIIHAVLFALFGIGSLILSVFGGVLLLVNTSNDSTGAVIGLITGAIMAVLYGLTLVRTLRPGWIKNIPIIYWIIMTVVIVATIIAGVIGPISQERLRAQDTVLEDELPNIADAVNESTKESGKLPASLSELSSQSVLSKEAKKLITDNRVEYKPGEKLSSTTLTPGTMRMMPDTDMDQLGGTDPNVYHYTLCVDYKSADGGEPYDSSYKSERQRYDTSLSTYGHNAGRTCYDLQTDYLY